MEGKSFSQDVSVSAAQNIKERDYWLNKLSGEWEKNVFPYDNYSTGIIGRDFKEVNFSLPLELSERLLTMANASDVRLYSLLLTALQVLINKYTESDDVMVGVPIYRQPVEGEVDFINTVLVIRNRIQAGVTFKELLITVSRNLFEAIENQNYPLKTLLYKLGIPYSEHDDFPLFDMVILLENIHDRWYLQDIKTNIHFFFSREGREVKGTVEYNHFLYQEQTIQRIIKHLEHLLQIALFKVELEVSSIDLLTSEEKKRLLIDFNDTTREYPDQQIIHRLFEKQAAQTPDHIAVVGKERHLTYKKLNENANQLAYFLRKKRVNPDVVVGLMVDRSLEMIVGILGILKAGGSYMPIDTGAPKNRVMSMLEDSGSSLLLTNKTTVEAFGNAVLSTAYFNLEKPYLTLPRQPIKNLDDLPIPDRTLVNYEKYNQYIGQAMVKDCISIQATRGCPFHCAYCHKIWPKMHVVRAAENIFSEVMLYYNIGVRRLAFIDDIFNLNKTNSRRFFELILENGLDLQLFFPNGLRGDLLTRDYIDLIVKAGTVNIAMALETASPRLQKLIGKNLDIEKLRENIEYICETYPHVILELFTMHGFPTETKEEAMLTLNFIKRLQRVDFIYIGVLKIYPNTDMEKLALKNGISKEAIDSSTHLAAHELPNTLPFEKNFSLKYQSEFLNEYFLSRERLLHVLPFQMRILTRDELLQKYNSYLPTTVHSIAQLLEIFGIREEELPMKDWVKDDYMYVPGLNKKLRPYFPVKEPFKGAFKILLLDLSLTFSHKADRLHVFQEPPLGLMCLLTYINRKFGNKINGKIGKSRVDFDNFSQLKALLKEFQPDLIGLRTLTFYKDFFHETVSLIRNWGWDVPIVAGGPYATSDYERLLQDRGVDLAVLGEGEITFGQLVEAILENQGMLPAETALKQIPGIAFIPKMNNLTRNFGREIIFLDEHQEAFLKESSENPEHINRPGDLAYTIYTSGSTGNPKGALIHHQGLVNYIWWAAKTYVKGEKTNFPLYTSLAFDLTVTSIFTPLITGNAIVIYEGDDKDILIEKVIDENRVDVLKATPSHLKLVRDKKPKNSRIKRIISGGEELETYFAKEITENFYHKVTIYNEYGPTETVVGSMIYQFNEETANRKSLPIGIPIDNIQIYILNKDQKPVPEGVIGELVISGDGVARGYLNRPELTAEKFIEIHFYRSSRSSKTSIKIYKTGDLARWLPEGKIELLGRIDHQVKIRGFRIEPGEIEQQMRRRPDLKEVAIIARKDEEGHDYLCAYYVPTVISAPGEGVDITEMRQYLSLTLPDYMIPSYFVSLEQMPLTSNGKLDRTRLPEPQTLIACENYIPPRNETEEKLVEIWQNVLGIDKTKIGIDADFFELGGHSLKAVLLISRIHKEFDVKVTLADVFETQVIRRLAKHINQLAEDKFAPIKPVEKKEYYPLSSAQKRLYVLYHLEKSSTRYNSFKVLVFDGKFEREKAEKTFRDLIKRHESLRTSFILAQGEAQQKIHDPGDIEFDLEYFEAEEIQAPNLIQQFVRPFDLEKPPLLRVRLIQVGISRYIFMMDMHHIITDGVSLDLFVKEFMMMYGRSRTTPAPLKIQYKDFSEWQADMDKKGVIDKQEEFWLQQFKGSIPTLSLPTDFPPQQIQTSQGDIFEFELDKERTEALKELARKENVTMFMLLLALWNVLLAKITGQEDIIVGTTSAGRRHIDLNPVIGFFVNTLSLRNYPRGEKVFREFLEIIKEGTLKAFDNQDYPFEKLVSRIPGARNQDKNPLFNVMLELHGFEAQVVNLSPVEFSDLKVSSYEVGQKISLFDMNWVAVEGKEKMLITIEFNASLFQKETIKRLSNYFYNIVKQVIKNPGVKIADIEILEPGEKQKLLKTYKTQKLHLQSSEENAAVMNAGNRDNQPLRIKESLKSKVDFDF